MGVSLNREKRLDRHPASDYDPALFGAVVRQ
jgi:hypothetical protein